MRYSFMGSVAIALTVIGLTLSSAAARNATVQEQASYPSCSCQFGYPGRACVPAVTCTAEGGRCSASCEERSSQPQ
jgi:hypothetical protein